jgi:lipopolysaccharide/colanic/teichoic acid biosynthesis glycosyltransferase
MSLVGPRPPTPYEVDLYEDWHLERLATLPGITGMWQIQERNTVPFDEMVKLDIVYIREWSLSLDLEIILRTIPVVIFGRSG